MYMCMYVYTLAPTKEASIGGREAYLVSKEAYPIPVSTIVHVYVYVGLHAHAYVGVYAHVDVGVHAHVYVGVYAHVYVGVSAHV